MPIGTEPFRLASLLAASSPVVPNTESTWPNKISQISHSIINASIFSTFTNRTVYDEMLLSALHSCSSYVLSLCPNPAC